MYWSTIFSGSSDVGKLNKTKVFHSSFSCYLFLIYSYPSWFIHFNSWFSTSGRLWLWRAEQVMLMRRCFPTFYFRPVFRYGSCDDWQLIFFWINILISQAVDDLRVVYTVNGGHFKFMPLHRVSLDRLWNHLRFIAKTCFVSTQISNEICKHFCALFNNDCVYALLFSKKLTWKFLKYSTGLILQRTSFLSFFKNVEFRPPTKFKRQDNSTHFEAAAHRRRKM